MGAEREENKETMPRNVGNEGNPINIKPSRVLHEPGQRLLGSNNTDREPHAVATDHVRRVVVAAAARAGVGAGADNVVC